MWSAPELVLSELGHPRRGTRTPSGLFDCRGDPFVAGRVSSMRLHSDRIDTVEIAFASTVAVSFIALLASMAWLLFG